MIDVYGNVFNFSTYTSVYGNVFVLDTRLVLFREEVLSFTPNDVYSYCGCEVIVGITPQNPIDISY